MARFYAEIQGNRGEATRMGTASSGMYSHTRGWNVGVKVDCFVDDDGHDVCEVWETGGSSSPSRKKMIGKVTDSIAVVEEDMDDFESGRMKVLKQRRLG